MSARRTAATGLLLLALAACSERAHAPAPGRSAPRPSPGATSAGDPITPGGGDGGYDVQHYDLNLRITPHGRPSLAGTTTITATATQALSRFTLDLTGLNVTDVTVDGAPALHTRAPG